MNGPEQTLLLFPEQFPPDAETPEVLAEYDLLGIFRKRRLRPSSGREVYTHTNK